MKPIVFQFNASYIMKWFVWIIGITCIALLASCVKKKEEGKYIFNVDMSKEHDASRFKPEAGDKISISGGFNGWKKDDLILSDREGDWIFSASIDEYIQSKKGADNTGDTIEFKFVINAGDGREVPNQGWETLPIRKVLLADLENKKPVFVYNNEYDNKESYEVTFTVGMSNQKLLGFFRPEAGDEVIVSGPFCGWTSEGIKMKDEEGSGIYSVKLQIKQNPKEPLQYRFRILSKRKAILPNKGWESQGSRRWNITSSSKEIPYAEFNDTRRAARFIIDTKQWEEEGKFKSRKGDILQIKLLLDGKDHLSDALFQVKDNTYETALIIPLTVKEIKWQVVKNIKEDLTQLKDAEVDIKGTLITL